MTSNYATGDPGGELSYAWGVWWSGKIAEKCNQKIAHASDDDHNHKGHIDTIIDTQLIHMNTK